MDGHLEIGSDLGQIITFRIEHGDPLVLSCVRILEVDAGYVENERADDLIFEKSLVFYVDLNACVRHVLRVLSEVKNICLPCFETQKIGARSNFERSGIRRRLRSLRLSTICFSNSSPLSKG